MAEWYNLPIDKLASIHTFVISTDIGEWNLDDCIVGQAVLEFILCNIPKTMETLEIRFFTTSLDLAHPKYAFSRSRWANLDSSLARRKKLKDIILFYDINVSAIDKGFRDKPVPDDIRQGIDQRLPRCIGKRYSDFPTCCC